MTLNLNPEVIGTMPNVSGIIENLQNETKINKKGLAIYDHFGYNASRPTALAAILDFEKRSRVYSVYLTDYVYGISRASKSVEKKTISIKYKVCWVLYKSILLYNMFIGLFQSSLDISYLFIKYLKLSPIMVVQLYNEYLTI